MSLKSRFILFLVFSSLLTGNLILGSNPVSSSADEQSRVSLIYDEIEINDDIGSSTQSEPAIAFFLNWRYIVWQDMRMGDPDIYFSSSSDNGASWGDGKTDSDIRINDDTKTASQVTPDLAVDSKGYLYAVWSDFRFNNWDIFLSISSNNGITWSNNIPINGTDKWLSNQLFPHITIDENDIIYILFEDDGGTYSDIKITRSTDGGKSFSQKYDLTKTSAVNDRQNSDLSLDGKGSLHFVWSEAINNFNSKIMYTSMEGAWLNFSNPVKIDDGSLNVLKVYPSIDVDDNGDVFISWLENDNNEFNIFFDKRFEYDPDFHDDIKINSANFEVNPETKPDIAVTETGMLYITWVGIQSGNHIIVSESANGGLTFNSGTVIDRTNQLGRSPTLEARQERKNPIIYPIGKNLDITWEDYRNDPLPDNGIPENGDIFYNYLSGQSNKKPSGISIELKVLSWSSILVNWSLNHDPDFNYYKLEVSSENNFDQAKIIETIKIEERLMISRLLTIFQPESEYFFRISVTDSGNLTNTSSIFTTTTASNIPPAVKILEPDGTSDRANNSFVIKWEDSDPDDNATLKIYYYNDFFGRNLIATIPEGEDGGLDEFTWNTSNLEEGEYLIEISIDDSYNQLVLKVSDFQVYVNHHEDSDAPRIIGLFPGELETEILLDTEIWIKFNEPLKEGTFNKSISLFAEDFGIVNGDIFYDRFNHTIIFKPEKRLNLFTMYEVSFQAEIQDMVGNSEKISRNWKFQTISFEVNFLDPMDMAENVTLDREIVIVFSESMNTTSVEKTIVFQPIIDGLIFNWSLNDSKLRIKHEDFTHNSEYVIQLGPNLKTQSGKVSLKSFKIVFYSEYKNFSPSLFDFGYFEYENKYYFYVEYFDNNNDTPGKFDIVIYRDNELFQSGKMSLVSGIVLDIFNKTYLPNSDLYDRNFNNIELYYFDIELTEGRYKYYFEFEDVHGSKADGDSIPGSLENAAEGPEISEKPKDNKDYLLIFAIGLIFILLIILIFAERKLKDKSKNKVENEIKIKKIDMKKSQEPEKVTPEKISKKPVRKKKKSLNKNEIEE